MATSRRRRRGGAGEDEGGGAAGGGGGLCIMSEHASVKLEAKGRKKKKREVAESS
ncbi:hypothetical protein CRG98_035269 [Punica granatum]|uniref:Uncharacterized protein n=1 Tax=Punica granatum TaxID=22663 RepID=A0A2I0IK30_PUNGR|nr:hypothetical protein CRG98_035269 [Punica granatum]